MPSLRETYAQVYNRQNVLFEQNADISVKLSSDKKPRHFSLKDVYAKEILKAANDYTYNIEGVIAEWVKSGGWSSKEANTILVPRILNIIKNHIDIADQDNTQSVVNGINSMIQKKNSVKLYERSLNSKTTNFLNFFQQGISTGHIPEIFNNNGIIEDIINIKEFTEGSVGVGAGEIFITLFSEAKNPAAGDLVLQDGSHVELKSGGGRPGKVSQTKAIDGIREMIKFLEQKYKTDKKIYEKHINKNIKNFISIINSAIQENTFTQHELSKIKLYVLELLDKNISDIFLSPDKINTVQNILNKKNINFSFKDLVNAINYYNNLNIGQGFTSNFYKYFDYVYSDGISLHLQEVTQIIKKFIHRKVDKPTENFIKKNLLSAANEDYKKTIAVLITGLQIADYAEEDGFKYIVFFDPAKKRQVIIQNNGSVLDILEQFLSVQNNITIAAGTGGMGPDGSGGGARGGFNVSVK
jgi:hypothetical protein